MKFDTGGSGDVVVFYRTSATPTPHSFRATGRLLRADGSVVPESVFETGPDQWNVLVEPDQR